MPDIEPNKAAKQRSATKKASPPATKRAQIEVLLRRKKGAKLADLQKTTGWQAHSIRAALSGLRKKGITVKADKNTKGETIYRAGH
jgi:predicted ArsR family transcriptional regulator